MNFMNFLTRLFELTVKPLLTGLVLLLGGVSAFASTTPTEFLQPDKAFAMTAEVVDGNNLLAHWKIADGYYMYRDKFRFKLVNPENVSLVNAVLPPGITKNDQFFGRIQVFHDNVEARIPLVRSTASASDVMLELTYQGCAEAGLCYPPITRQVKLSLPEAVATAGVVTNTTTSADPEHGLLSEQDSIARSLASGNSWLTVLSFLGFGLLLAFTPCVFPMIPILSSIIVGQGENTTTLKAFTISLVYVLAMAVTYTIAGVVAGMVGENLQAVFQNPWILASFAGVFVLLSFSMFGFYELQLPNSLQSRLTEISNRQQGGTLFGVAIMGVLSALIVGPCVAAPLAGALIYIGQAGDPWLGGAALFSLSMGMGIPLIIIGTSAGKLLPRVGGWMDAIKAVFGVMLLAVAIWMLERILPATVTMILWALLLIISAIYMGALEPVKDGVSGWVRLWKGLGLSLLVYGVLLLLGVAAGGQDYVQPLRGVWSGSSHSGARTEHLVFKSIKSVADLDRELASAVAEGKPVMLDFYADWCVSCKEYEKYTFSDERVQNALSGYILLQADVTANDEQDRALLKSLNILGPPSIMFYGLDGKELRRHRLVGFAGAEDFVAHVKQISY